VHLLKDDEKEDDEDHNADVILEPEWAVVGITPARWRLKPHIAHGRRP
jgi:hypothetical protein